MFQKLCLSPFFPRQAGSLPYNEAGGTPELPVKKALFFIIQTGYILSACRSGGIGRRNGLKIRRFLTGHAGSSPAFGIPVKPACAGFCFLPIHYLAKTMK